MKIFSTILLLSLFKLAYSQEFSISGKKADLGSSLNKYDPAIEIRFLNTFFHLSDYSKGTSEYINADNDNFKVSFTSTNPIGYLKISAVNMPSTLFSNILLFRAGDHVTFNRDTTGQVYYTGRGSSVLNYQIWLGKLLKTDYKKDFTPKGIENQKRRIIEISKEVQDTLNAHRTEWGDTFYNFMKQMSASTITKYFVIGISPARFSLIDSTYSALLKNEMGFLLHQQQSFMYDKEESLIDNIYFLSFLYALIDNYTKSNRLENIDFKDQVYQEILKFDHLIRDKLLTYYVLSNQSTLNSYNHFYEILSNVKDEKSKQIIEKMSILLPGAPIKDFDFEDAQGKKVSFSDFHGRVLVIKTWYRGCISCAKLSQLFEPVITHYENNDKVVFLSVNADISRDVFLEGIESGLFGDAKQVKFVYTNGLGFSHPMMLHFNYYGAPNMLLVDKNGLVVSSSPPRTNNDKLISEWIDMIDKALQE